MSQDVSDDLNSTFTVSMVFEDNCLFESDRIYCWTFGWQAPLLLRDVMILDTNMLEVVIDMYSLVVETAVFPKAGHAS